MIIDWIFNLIFYLFSNLISVLPDMTLLPDSFNTAWEFLGTSIANFLWILAPSMASDIITSMSLIVYLSMLLFTWYLLLQIWHALRG